MVENDALHNKTIALHQKLVEKGAKVFLLSSTLGEFVPVCTNKIGVQRAQQAVQTFIRTYILVHIDVEIMKEALSLSGLLLFELGQ